MIMTDEQRRWWFATHPEFSWSRTRPRPFGTRHGDSDFPESSKTALANERLRKALGYPAIAPDTYDKYAQSRAERELYRQAFGGPEPGLIPDPHTALDVIPYARSTMTPAQALRSVLGRMARDAVVSNIRRPPRLPPKGTPERAKIESARRRGRNRKRSDELADINADGEGSGVWTKKELEEIKKTTKFPPDTIWHHEPTVANRPKLADNPRAVRPMRGGRKAHLQDGHGGNWQNPYDPGGKAPWE